MINEYKFGIEMNRTIELYNWLRINNQKFKTENGQDFLGPIVEFGMIDVGLLKSASNEVIEYLNLGI